jgi:hypothetical protein
MVESGHLREHSGIMEPQSARLEMTVSEPWEFGTGPVIMGVLERPSDFNWVVSIVDGSPSLSGVSHADLQARYVGETLLPLLTGERVIVTLGFRVNGGHQGLIGSAILIP